MEFEMKTLLIYSAIFLALFISSELFYRITKCKAEYTRKFVHLMTGLIALSFPFYIKAPIGIIILCSSFLFILILSQKYKLLESVNGVKRKTRGSILYPLVVILAYIAQWYYQSYNLYFIPILILAVSDPLASLIGQKMPIRKIKYLKNPKSIGGSLSFFISAYAISYLTFFYFGQHDHSYSIYFSALIIAFTTMIVEAISLNGYDNLTIPLAAIAVLIIV